MIHMALLFASLLSATSALGDDVYHCNIDGKTVLQGHPCPDGSTVNKIRGETAQSGSQRLPEPPVGAAPENSAWRVREKASPIDDSRTVFVSVPALEVVQDKFGRERRPVLAIRCSEGSTSFFLNFDGFHMADLNSYGSVTMRVDSQPAVSIRMTESTDNEALGLWRGASPVRMASRLMGGRVLTVRAVPYSESPIIVRFPISGLDHAIAPLRRACRW